MLLPSVPAYQDLPPLTQRAATPRPCSHMKDLARSLPRSGMPNILSFDLFQTYQPKNSASGLLFSFDETGSEEGRDAAFTVLGSLSTSAEQTPSVSPPHYPKSPPYPFTSSFSDPVAVFSRRVISTGCSGKAAMAFTVTRCLAPRQPEPSQVSAGMAAALRSTAKGVSSCENLPLGSRYSTLVEMEPCLLLNHFSSCTHALYYLPELTLCPGQLSSHESFTPNSFCLIAKRTENCPNCPCAHKIADLNSSLNSSVSLLPEQMHNGQEQF